MFVYEKKLQYPVKIKNTKAGCGHYQPIWRTGRRAGSVAAVFEPAVFYALCGTEGIADRYRYRGVVMCPFPSIRLSMTSIRRGILHLQAQE